MLSWLSMIFLISSMVKLTIPSFNNMILIISTKINSFINSSTKVIWIENLKNKIHFYLYHLKTIHKLNINESIQISLNNNCLNFIILHQKRFLLLSKLHKVILNLYFFFIIVYLLWFNFFDNGFRYFINVPYVFFRWTEEMNLRWILQKIYYFSITLLKKIIYLRIKVSIVFCY